MNTVLITLEVTESIFYQYQEKFRQISLTR